MEELKREIPDHREGEAMSGGVHVGAISALDAQRAGMRTFAEVCTAVLDGVQTTLDSTADTLEKLHDAWKRRVEECGAELAAAQEALDAYLASADEPGMCDWEYRAVATAPAVATNGGPEAAFGLPTFRIGSRPTTSMVPASAGSAGSSSREAIQQLATLRREGPEYGIHVIATCDTVPSVGQVLSPDARGLRAARSAEDAAERLLRTVDSPAANLLSDVRGILFDREERQHKKFRPYALPPEEWLASVVAALVR